MKNLITFLLQWFGLKAPMTQTSQAERDCLARHAASCKRAAEIGVYQGVTTRVLRNAVHPDGLIFGIDPFPPNRLGICFYRLIAEKNVDRVKNGMVKWIALTGAEASREPQIREGGPLDFLFIDGDHSWEGIEADWNGFKDLIAPEGIVALHDSRNAGGCGSQKFTEDVILKDANFRVEEMVDSLTVIRRVPMPESGAETRRESGTAG